MTRRPTRSPLLPYTTLFRSYLIMELGFASGAAAVCEISRGERPRSAGYLELTVVGTDGLISRAWDAEDRKSTRLNSSHVKISYAVFCLKKKKNTPQYSFTDA